MRAGHAIANGTPEIQDIAKRYITPGVGLEEFEKLLAWLKANPLPRRERPKKEQKPGRTYVKCSCGQMQNNSGLRQHLNTALVHRPANAKAFRNGSLMDNGLTHEQVEGMVAEIREANSEPLRCRQATFEEMFER